MEPRHFEPPSRAAAILVHRRRSSLISLSWISFSRGLGADRRAGAAHVGTPSRGSNQTWMAIQTARNRSNSNQLSIF
jgi:hypothetical protein